MDDLKLFGSISEKLKQYLNSPSPFPFQLQLTKEEGAALPEYVKVITKGGEADEKTAELQQIAATNMQAVEQALASFYSSPLGQTAMEESLRLKRKGRATEAAMEGMDFLATVAEIGTTMRAIGEAKSDLRSVVPPTAPTLPPRSRELDEAVDLARTRAYNPYSSPEVGALLGSQAMDTLKGLQTAKQVSGGQASQFQANAQDVIDRSRFGKIQAASTMMEGQRQAQDQFLGAAQAKAQEGLQRNQLQQGIYRTKMGQYGLDKQLADAALSSQRGNMLTALQNAEVRLPNAIGGGVARLYNQPNSYTGLGTEVDTLSNRAEQVTNRLRNSQMLFNTDYGNPQNLMGYNTFNQQY